MQFYHLSSSLQNRKRSLAIIGVAFLALVQFRLSLPRSAVPFATADNPTSKDASAWTRFLTFLYLPAFNAQLMLLPTTLSFDWSMDAIPRISSWTDSRNLVSTVFYGGLLSLLLIIVNQHFTLHKQAGQQRINSAIKRRIQAQSSSIKPQSLCSSVTSVFCTATTNHNVMPNKMSIVRNYLINGRATNPVSAYTNKRGRRKRTMFSAQKEDTEEQTQTLLSSLHLGQGQTFGRTGQGKASKIRSLTAYTGE